MQLPISLPGDLLGQAAAKQLDVHQVAIAALSHAIEHGQPDLTRRLNAGTVEVALTVPDDLMLHAKTLGIRISRCIHLGLINALDHHYVAAAGAEHLAKGGFGDNRKQRVAARTLEGDSDGFVARGTKSERSGTRI